MSLLESKSEASTAEMERLPAEAASSGELLRLGANLSADVRQVSERILMTVICSAETQEARRASEVTHLSLRIEDTSDDDIIFVKAWQEAGGDE